MGMKLLTPVSAAPDTSPSKFRDDDPQSGGSGGKIYDFDGPGPEAIVPTNVGTIVRWRLNFNQWGVYSNAAGQEIRCSATNLWYTRQSYKWTGPPFEVGQATGASANTLADSSKSWTPNMWAPGAVEIKQGTTGGGQARRVTANTATNLTVAPNWDITPDPTSIYAVASTSTWTKVSDVADDNKNADGTTKITWDLN